MKITIAHPGGPIEHELDRPETLIGRSDECDIVIDSDKLSRKHCCIRYLKDTDMGEQLYIMDLGSKNGVIVDETKIEPNVYTPFRLGSIVLLANQCILSINPHKRIEITGSGTSAMAPSRQKSKSFDKKDLTPDKPQMNVNHLILILLAAICTIGYLFIQNK